MNIIKSQFTAMDVPFIIEWVANPSKEQFSQYMIVFDQTGILYGELNIPLEEFLKTTFLKQATTELLTPPKTIGVLNVREA